MAGQATGCNGHRHEHKHRRPSLVPHPTGDDDEKELVGVQGGGRSISPQYKDRMTAGTAGGG